MSTLRRMTLIVLPLGIPLIAMAEADSSPLIEKVRQATAQYRDIHVAVSQGFVPATPCASGPDHGAMGVHYVLVDRLVNGVLDATKPEALIYEPMANGAMRARSLAWINCRGNLHRSAGVARRLGQDPGGRRHPWQRADTVRAFGSHCVPTA